jgi:exportin-5
MSVSLPSALQSQVGQTLLAALRAIHDANTSSHDRMQATQFCEQIKNQYQESIPLALQIVAEAELPPTVRHFGFHCLNHFVSSMWNQLSSQDRLYIREQSLVTCSKTQWKEAPQIALVISEIAKRQWPQEWPDMLQVLSKVASVNANTLLTVLHVFKNLGYVHLIYLRLKTIVVFEGHDLSHMKLSSLFFCSFAALD